MSPYELWMQRLQDAERQWLEASAQKRQFLRVEEQPRPIYTGQPPLGSAMPEWLVQGRLIVEDERRRRHAYERLLQEGIGLSQRRVTTHA